MDEHGQIEGAGLRLGFINAFNRANINTGTVFGVYARFGDYVGHGSISELGGGEPRALAYTIKDIFQGLVFYN